MAYRNSAADSGRKGAPSKTKETEGYQYVMPQPRGKWLPAYSGGAGASNGGMGRTASEWDDEIGSAGDEVGNDYDNDYDSNSPVPQN
jgi:hypothetical protein